jgi:hypothetical protein
LAVGVVEAVPMVLVKEQVVEVVPILLLGQGI